MQSRTWQKAAIDKAMRTGELHTFYWCAETNRAGVDGYVALDNGKMPVVPVVLWPHLDSHRDQAELSRLIAEIMCKSIRQRLRTSHEIQPALTSVVWMAECGQAWEEYQIVEFDYVCPHCGMVNESRCCADWRPKRKPKRKER